MKAYDAVVVGAGPAGSSAAHSLAGGGARVLVLEKARLPRYKACGGGISERARRASPLVNGFPVEASASDVIVSFGPRQVNCALPAPIGMTMRDRFDTYLAEQAMRAGAELRDRCRVTGIEPHDSSLIVTASGETITCSYLVGADGANGLTARLAGFSPWKTPGVAVEVELGVPESARERYGHTLLLDLHCIAGGYGWIFGKADHLSVGLGVFCANRPRDLHADLSRFLQRHADLKGGRIILQRGHLIPLAGGRSTRRRGRVLLAGDAAALADPLTAEGISYALASGRRAGESILAALGGNMAMIHGYDRYIKQDLCQDLRYAKIVATPTYRFPDVVARLTKEDQTLRDANVGAVAGTLEYRSLVLTMVRKAPTLLRALVTR
jgi:geranylgeranyl reductase family protein